MSTYLSIQLSLIIYHFPSISATLSSSLFLFQVAPLCFLTGESTWVAVEDGRLCPAGWNLDSLQFQWMFPHREFISRKKKIEEVKLLRDGVVQGRGQGVFMGTIGTDKGKGKGRGTGLEGKEVEVEGPKGSPEKVEELENGSDVVGANGSD